MGEHDDLGDQGSHDDVDGLGVRDVRPFVPAQDLARSQRFYEALGWRTTWAGDGLVLLELGDHRMYLQDHFVRAWAENTVLVVMVDDPVVWHERASAVLRSGDVGSARVLEPRVEPWGAVVTHVVDPSGVLLQLTKLDA